MPPEDLGISGQPPQQRTAPCSISRRARFTGSARTVRGNFPRLLRCFVWFHVTPCEKVVDHSVQTAPAQPLSIMSAITTLGSPWPATRRHKLATIAWLPEAGGHLPGAQEASGVGSVPARHRPPATHMHMLATRRFFSLRLPNPGQTQGMERLGAAGEECACAHAAGAGE